MSKLFEFEYRGLNIFDEISTVEIMINQEERRIHVFDQNNVVEPEFYFSKKCYQLSDGFFQMAQVLFKKKFIVFDGIDQLEQWTNQFRWIFYGSKNVILVYDQGEVNILCKITELKGENQKFPILFNKYLNRMVF